MTGTLLLAATPLGNPHDASQRLRDALASADVIAAEDTRRIKRLARDVEVQISGRVVSYFAGNEQARDPFLVEQVQAGHTVLVVTDAGAPALSDPGYSAVKAVYDSCPDAMVSALPGPSAVTTALMLSGIACDRFCFDGFPPRKPAARRRFFAERAAEPRTMVLFESPRRLRESLADAVSALGGQRMAAVCRELTKTHEQVLRGTLAELSAWAAGEVLGEITLVIEGASHTPVSDATPATLARAVTLLTEDGTHRRDAISQVATGYGVAKRVVFDAVVTHKSEVRGADQPEA